MDDSDRVLSAPGSGSTANDTRRSDTVKLGQSLPLVPDQLRNVGRNKGCGSRRREHGPINFSLLPAPLLLPEDLH